MYVTGRERKMLHILLTAQHQFTTLGELADHLQVSQRTVQRELNKLDDVLQQFHLGMDKQAGRGIRLTGSTDGFDKLESALLQVPTAELDAGERKILLLHYLMKQNTVVKLVELANEFQMPTAALSQTLDELEEFLRPYAVSIIRRRGYGIELSGDEKAKRRSLANLMMEELESSSIYSIHGGQLFNQRTLDHQVFTIVNREEFDQVDQLIKPFIEELPYPLTDSAYVSLLLHICLSLQRIRAGATVEHHDQLLEELQALPEYRIADQIISTLSQAFDMTIEEQETGYITIHLKTAKRRFQEQFVDQLINPELAVTVHQLVRAISDRLNVNLLDDPDLIEGLIAHIEPGIQRAKERNFTYNPLTNRIKREYPELFEAVRSSVAEVLPGYDFPDGELAFLALHFGSALEGQAEPGHLSVLVVCASGIGTSKMIASRLHKEFDEMKSITLSSIREVEKHLEESHFDLIVSTVGLSGLTEDYLLVNPLLPQSDAEKIRKTIHDIKPMKKPSALKQKPGDETPFLHRLKQMNQYANAVEQVLKQFRLEHIEGSISFSDVLKKIDLALFEEKMIEESGSVYRNLMERESIGGMGLPDTGLALYHCRDDMIRQPVFRLYDLPEPYELKGMDGAFMPVSRLILMVSPEDQESRGAEVLSTISGSLVEEESTMRLIRNGSEKEIFQFLQKTLHDFYTEKSKNLMEGTS
ncbi:BglG family transcription antiterminator [Jeotgalibacillus sp. R-1-5s-1]|uniref:BglG family transcription antiterminator n=1 Tax=Jeotgalibacillus sp. R-1-5s-1 TaxID=2555897 RepID=UPI00106969EB|nr:BglG family transcription antiterminator [Jeotgalibacillus sp. R-1-5s-1]TFE00815.1 PRD domain-containing protein [Jeotgalibacillus sp. R-1-5s-1]